MTAADLKATMGEPTARESDEMGGDICSGMRRNACVVLGNRGNEEALSVLARALADPDPVLRSHAAWALGAIGGIRARALLEQSAAAETAEEARVEIGRALGRISG